MTATTSVMAVWSSAVRSCSHPAAITDDFAPGHAPRLPPPPVARARITRLDTRGEGDPGRPSTPTTTWLTGPLLAQVPVGKFTAPPPAR